MKLGRFMQNHKKKKLLLICLLYIGVSVLIMLLSDKNGIPSYWWVQPISGPLWYLSAAISAIRRPFHYLDGVIRVKAEDIFTTLIFVSLWLVGLLPLVTCLLSEQRKSKIFSIIGFLIFWGVAFCLNIYLLSLFAG